MLNGSIPLSPKQPLGSPKFLIGESYGTTRVSGLALELQIHNGCILEWGSTGFTNYFRDRRGDALFCFYVCISLLRWYHKALKSDLQAKP
ncbi:hypothetical protein CS542_01995 [Pedobacter sp. IW39]|nr:hypothetical protein CS542_01995 [Pedobacter sp. IW39]